jgi:hypothetical protein
MLFIWCGTGEGGKSITRPFGGGGGGQKIETFLGPEMARSVARAIWAHFYELLV